MAPYSASLSPDRPPSTVRPGRETQRLGVRGARRWQRLQQHGGTQRGRARGGAGGDLVRGAGGGESADQHGGWKQEEEAENCDRSELLFLFFILF